MRRDECGRGSPVELVWKLRQPLGTLRVFELAPAVGGGREPARRQRCEHLAPFRPDAPEERDKLMSPFLDKAHFVTSPRASCPR
ncbi:hypothetical protein BE08_43295 [Sorangium cellulosum]|uniref:Uncharacterized protein n=1 Tax=Sorangium cellulosum TaxID=56 RepID=A0A150PU62_SORCE|nr:hypothetical protein BE08_43295 [Sorangium cellulosum]